MTFTGLLATATTQVDQAPLTPGAKAGLLVLLLGFCLLFLLFVLIAESDNR